MTAISPLQSIHKKGLFGDHQKKDERRLLNISEAKDLTIVQTVQYKKSKVQLNSVQVDGIEFPLQNSKVSSNKETRILWNAPNTWLVISRKENIVETINQISGALQSILVLLFDETFRFSKGKFKPSINKSFICTFDLLYLAI